jgi:hypothetical protein
VSNSDNETGTYLYNYNKHYDGERISGEANNCGTGSGDNMYV